MEAVLLPYQAELCLEVDAHPVNVAVKSRRIGYSWTGAYKAVELAGAAGGMDVWYIGYNEDMTREFIGDCTAWAERLSMVVAGSGEDLIGDDKDLRSFWLSFASGYKIQAVSSKPRNLRGKQGLVIIDEAAFHDDLPGLIKAAMALLIWGGKVLIISTLNGEDNPFWELVEDIRKGKLNYNLLQVDFDQALEQGLHKRICQMSSESWSAGKQASWRQEIIDRYGDNADEELFCQPRKSGDSYMPRYIVERCMTGDYKVQELELPVEFVDFAGDVRRSTILGWCSERIAPIIAEHKDKSSNWRLGMDFARQGLSSIFAGYTGNDMRRWAPVQIELRNVPFDQQEQLLYWLMDELQIEAAALDARGNGQMLAERARQHYGEEVIQQVMATRAWYGEHFPKLKAAFEDEQIQIARHEPTVQDLRAVKLDKGVPIIPAVNSGSKTKARHADSASALVLYWAASLEEIPDYGDGQEQKQERRSAY